MLRPADWRASWVCFTYFFVSTRLPRIRRRWSLIPAAGHALELQLYDQSDWDHKTGGPTHPGLRRRRRLPAAEPGQRISGE
jgi:hypothetical protein